MNIRDAESAYQEGRIMFLEFQKEFLKVWYEPLYRAQLGALMASMSPEDMMTPGMEVVAPVIQELLGGGNASTVSRQRMEIPWTGNPGEVGNRPAPPLPNG